MLNDTVHFFSTIHSRKRWMTIEWTYIVIHKLRKYIKATVLLESFYVIQQKAYYFSKIVKSNEIEQDRGIEEPLIRAQSCAPSLFNHRLNLANISKRDVYNVLFLPRWFFSRPYVLIFACRLSIGRWDGFIWSDAINGRNRCTRQEIHK